MDELELRQLGVYVDGERIAEDLRIRLKGRATISLKPDLWVVDIFELSREHYDMLQDGKEIQVTGEDDSVLCQGTIDEVYVHTEDGKEITSVSVADGINFWESFVNLSLGPGNDIDKTIRYIVSRCSSPVKITNIISKNQVLVRGQVFQGRTVQYVQDLAKSINARAFLNRNSLSILNRRVQSTVIDMQTGDEIASMAYSNGMVVARLTVMKGYQIGQMVLLPDTISKFRLICQSVEADNLKGSWQTDLILLDDDMITDSDWSGG